jgi:hypothetical protein
MISLVSPEYSLEMFCSKMSGKDPLAVMEAASVEICYAKRFSREATEDSDFPEGSLGWRYCDSLQKLIYLLMNGSIANGATREFPTVVKPLVRQLIQSFPIPQFCSMVAEICDLSSRLSGVTLLRSVKSRWANVIPARLMSGFSINIMSVIDNYNKITR